MSVKQDCLLPVIQFDLNLMVTDPVQFTAGKQDELQAVGKHIIRRKDLNEGRGLLPSHVAGALKSKGISTNQMEVNRWLIDKGYQTLERRIVMDGTLRKVYRYYFETAECKANAWAQVNQDTDTGRSLTWHVSIVDVIYDDLKEE